MSVQNYGTTASGNTSVGTGVDAVDIGEGMARNLVNNALRGMAADIARHTIDNTFLLTTGTAAALAVTTNSEWAGTGYTDLLALEVKLHVAPEAGATLSVDGLGARPLRAVGPTGARAIRSGELLAGHVVRVLYETDGFVVTSTALGNHAGAEVSLADFGGVADLVLDADGKTASGTDNNAAITAMIAEMVATGRPGRFEPGAYRVIGEVELPQGTVFEMPGEDDLTVHFETVPGSVGFRNLGATFRGSVTLSGQKTGNKELDNGGDQALMLVGEGYFTTTDQAEINFFDIERVRCHSATNTGFTGDVYGVYIMGNVNGGSIGYVHDRGSVGQLAGTLSAHWAAKNNAGGYGFAHDEIYPVGGFKVGTVYGTKSSDVLTLSSVFDVTVDEVYADGATVNRAFYWLPGDEGARLTRAALQDRQGKGCRIEEIKIRESSGSGNECIDINGVGTSPYAFYADDGTVPLKTALDAGLEIGTISATNDPGTTQKLCFVNELSGRLSIGKIDAPNWDAGAIFETNFCTAEIRVGDCIGQNRVIIDRSTDVEIENCAPTVNTINNSSISALYIFGQTHDTTLDGAVSAGATKIVLDTAFTVDIPKGATLVVDGEAIPSAAFFEQTGTNKCLTIELERGLENAAADGATVTLDLQSTGKAGGKTKGGYHGADIANSRFDLEGMEFTYAGQRGVQTRDGAVVFFDDPKFIGNGLNGGSTADLYAAIGSTVRGRGGLFGVHGSAVNYNIIVPTSDPATDRRVVWIGGLFGENISGEYTASSTSDIILTDCARIDDGSAVVVS